MFKRGFLFMEDIKEKRIRNLIYRILREVEAFLNIEGSIKLRLENDFKSSSNDEAIIDYSNYVIIYNLNIIRNYTLDEIYISVLLNVRSLYHMFEVVLLDDLSLLGYKDSKKDILKYIYEFESGKFKLNDSFSHIDSLSFAKLYMEIFKSRTISTPERFSEKIEKRMIELLKIFEPKINRK